MIVDISSISADNIRFESMSASFSISDNTIDLSSYELDWDQARPLIEIINILRQLKEIHEESNQEERSQLINRLIHFPLHFLFMGSGNNGKSHLSDRF